MKLSIVIVSYNTREELIPALDSLIVECANLEHEIIVVDNHGRDGVKELVQTAYPTVRLLVPDDNRWFTGGNNLGLRAAQGELLWMLNPDTVTTPGAPFHMIAYMDAHPTIGVLTSRMVFPDGSYQRTCSRLADYIDLLLDYTFVGVLLASYRARRRTRMWYSDWDRESDREVEVVPGSNFMYRRSVMQQVGGYDEDLLLYFPEDDLCRRVLAAGYDIRYLASATIIHHEHASTDKSRHRAQQIYFRDLFVYTGKHFGGWRAALLKLLVVPTRVGIGIKSSVVALIRSKAIM
ncbi:MAG: glycosyltransferase family 2 protein [Chloroflexota bacterium]|nr:glycosyltransferase family 2 protein [Chloroflexota bacterium]